MIEILDESTDTCLVVHFGGKVTGEEYQKFLDALGERFKTSDRVSVVVELSSFKSYGDLESAKKDLKFGVGDYRRIHRAAFVGDQKWLEWFTRLIGPFTRAEEKHFSEGEIDTAVGWASSRVNAGERTR
jgi:hypothetical protein